MMIVKMHEEVSNHDIRYLLCKHIVYLHLFYIILYWVYNFTSAVFGIDGFGGM